MSTGRARELVRLVGGAENIERLWHCMSRLRFALIDDSLVDVEALSQRDDVVAVLKRPLGETHVAVRRDLFAVHDEIQEILGGTTTDLSR